MFSCKILLCYFSKLSTCQLTNKSYFLFRGLSRTSFVNSVTEKILYYILKKNNGFYKQSVFTSCLTQLRIQRGNFSTYSDAQCWNCHRYLECEKFCCHLCGALQYPPKRINYFELFGISQMFDMDLEDLSLKFKNMQMTFHPDKYANKSKIELEISETYSRLVNKAYTTLKDPLKRGFYLLELKNLSPDETFPIDEEFLTTIMEKNEELESINSESSLKIFMKANREEINKHINLISKSFHCDNWKEARTNLLKLNYFINLDSKIKGKQSDVIFSKKN